MKFSEFWQRDRGIQGHNPKVCQGATTFLMRDTRTQGYTSKSERESNFLREGHRDTGTQAQNLPVIVTFLTRDTGIQGHRKITLFMTHLVQFYEILWILTEGYRDTTPKSARGWQHFYEGQKDTGIQPKVWERATFWQRDPGIQGHKPKIYQW